MAKKKNKSKVKVPVRCIRVEYADLIDQASSVFFSAVAIFMLLTAVYVLWVVVWSKSSLLHTNFKGETIKVAALHL